MADDGQGLVLGYDFGTSALKAALFDKAGRVVASGTGPYKLLLPEPGWAEQYPTDWWEAMGAVTPRLLQDSGAEASRIAAIGVTAQMCGVVPVDAEGEALVNALIWLDTRSTGEADRLIGGWPKIGGYGLINLIRWLRLTGGAPNPAGKDPPTKMMWLKANAPAAWARTHRLLDVKDYIVHRLTGRFATSFDCAHLTWLFDARAQRKQWSATLMRRAGVARDLLPDIARATDIVGGLTAEAAERLTLREGTPVVAGLGDVSAAALAAGAPEHGAPHLGLGSSAWLGAMLPKSRVNPLTNIGSISGADGKDYLLVAAQENGGSCVGWALRTLGFADGDFAGFERCAGEARPRVDGPMFLPWLAGERVPADDKNLRGGFLNLGPNDGRAEMARAVYEGVALNVRWAMSDFDRLAGSAGKALRVVGGAAVSRLWCQIFADVLGRPVEPIENPVLGGPLGAAMAASVAAGWHKKLADAAMMTRTGRRFEPAPELAPLYDLRFRRFAAAHKKLRPWYAGARESGA